MPNHQPKIMVVDDDPGMRLTLEGILEDEGFDVVGAEDGYKAIELARQSPFDLVFMDIKMPGMDGFTALEKIRRFDPQAKAIFISPCTMEDSVTKSLRDGAHTALAKPVDPDALLDLIRSVTGQPVG